MYTVVGHCPKCGAPVYTYSVWHAVTPPPSMPSCQCNPRVNPVTATNITEGGKA